MKTIEDLREHMFAVMDGLRDKSMTVETAKAMSEAAQTIINSAKVEVEYVRAVEGSQSLFLGGKQSVIEGHPQLRRVVHKLK